MKSFRTTIGILAASAVMIPAIAAAGASCISADGVMVPSGQTVVPDQGLSGHHMSVYYTCRDGQWYFNGVRVLARPRIGRGHAIITR
jgi:hypothetical protein